MSYPQKITKKPYVEVSGRKRLRRKGGRLDRPHAEGCGGAGSAETSGYGAAELAATANALAIGALRFFLLKFTRNTIIAFDFEDALSAEGETGPYCQYAIVRIRGIRRKGNRSARSRVTRN